jgi:hypothetical protein
MFFSLRANFGLYKVLPLANLSLDLLECAERHGSHGRSAQKQQHRRVCNLSSSFVVKFVYLSVKRFASIES